MTAVAGAPPEFASLLHCVPDIDAAGAAYRAAGFSVGVDGVRDGVRIGHFRFDWRSALLVSVVDPESMARAGHLEELNSLRPAIEELTTAGGGGLCFDLWVPDLEAAMTGLRRRGRDCVAVERRTGRGDVLLSTGATVVDAPSWAPRLRCLPDDVGRRKRAWRERAGGYDHRRSTLVGIVVETPDPLESVLWLRDVTGVEPAAEPTMLPLPDLDVHFTAGIRDRVTHLLFDGNDPPSTTVAGLRLCPYWAID